VNTLRAALSESAHRPPYAINDTLRIRFNIPGSNQTITLGSDLPVSFRVGIDGSTQTGTVLNTSFLPNGLNLAPKVNIQGALFPLRNDSSYVKNLRVERLYMYGNAQALSHSAIQELTIEGNNTRIGGELGSNRIGKIGLFSNGNTVEANFIGVDNSGLNSIALDNDPIVRLFGSQNYVSNNLIGGANNQAIQIEPDSALGRFASNNVLSNNLIGVSPDEQIQGYIQSDAIEIKNGASCFNVRFHSENTES
jgi:hypothetical protein